MCEFYPTIQLKQVSSWFPENKCLLNLLIWNNINKFVEKLRMVLYPWNLLNNNMFNDILRATQIIEEQHEQSTNYVIWKLILFLYCPINKLEIFWKYFSNLQGTNKIQKKRMQNKKIQIKPTLNIKLALHVNCWCQHMFQVNNRNTRTRCEICSKSTIKTPEDSRDSSVFIVNFDHILNLALVFLLLTLSR